MQFLAAISSAGPERWLLLLYLLELPQEVAVLAPQFRVLSIDLGQLCSELCHLKLERLIGLLHCSNVRDGGLHDIIYECVRVYRFEE